MILTILLTTLSLSLAFVIITVLEIVIRNSKAHKFFKKKSPNLPVLSDVNIFNGHLYKTILAHRNCVAYDELHKTYGPTFGFYRFDQPWVATKDIDLIKKIEIDESYKHLDRVSYKSISNEFDHSIFQVNGDRWRRVRQVMSPALSNHKVRSHEVTTLVEKVINDLKSSIDNKLNDPKSVDYNNGEKSVIIDAHDVASRFTLSLTFSVMYKQDNIIDFNTKYEPWTRTIHDAAGGIEGVGVVSGSMSPLLNQVIRRMAQFTIFGRLNLRIRNFILLAFDLNKAARERRERLRKKLDLDEDDTRLKDPGSSRRLIDTLIDAFFEKKIPYEEMIGSGSFMVTAGFVTTADAITCILWQLARNQAIQDKLRQSIIDNGLDADYLTWCILEALRWHPPVPLGVGRVLGEDVETKSGLIIPKGSFVQPTIYSVHHDENIWPEADKYNPDRWAQRSEFHPGAFLGFGLGPRNCIGSKLAMHEIKLLIQEVMLNYRVGTCSDTSDNMNFRAPGMIWTVLDNPIKLRLTKLAAAS